MVFKWANLNIGRYPCLAFMFSSQAGVKMSAITARNAKLTGMKAGTPDIYLPYPNSKYSGLWIEMKRPKTTKSPKGVLSNEQKKWLEYLNKVGYRAIVAYGYEEAVAELKNYLSIPAGIPVQSQE